MFTGLWRNHGPLSKDELQAPDSEYGLQVINGLRFVSSVFHPSAPVVILGPAIVNLLTYKSTPQPEETAYFVHCYTLKA